MMACNMRRLSEIAAESAELAAREAEMRAALAALLASRAPCASADDESALAEISEAEQWCGHHLGPTCLLHICTACLPRGHGRAGSAPAGLHQLPIRLCA